MKKIVLALTILSFSGIITSCSKCYDCTYEVEITDSNGNVTGTEPVTEDYCSTSQADLDAKEDEGYSCSAK